MGWPRHLLFLAFFVLACSSGTQDQGVEGTPFCRRIRRCLRTTLPTTYRPAMHSDVLAKAGVCLGPDARSIWTTRDCLPFEFGRDEASGVGMQVAVDCSDVCPMNARIMLRFAEPVAPFECACLGVTPRHDADWGQYLGCSPVACENRGLGLHVARATPPESGFVVMGGQDDLARRAFGLDSGRPVIAVDGLTVADAGQLEQVLVDLPHALPGSIRTRAAGTADPRQPSEVVLHYPPKSVFQELVRVAAEIDFAHIGETASRCGARANYGSIHFAGRSVRYQRDCDDDASKRLSLLALAIQQAAEHALPRHASAPATAAACRELRTLPTSAILEQDGRAIALKYVDWLSR